MGAMEEELAATESLGEGKKFTYQEIANKYGVNRCTLSRRHRCPALNEGVGSQ
jgi:uncharacterized protein YerC